MNMRCSNIEGCFLHMKIIAEHWIILNSFFLFHIYFHCHLLASPGKALNFRKIMKKKLHCWRLSCPSRSRSCLVLRNPIASLNVHLQWYLVMTCLYGLGQIIDYRSSLGLSFFMCNMGMIELE